LEEKITAFGRKSNNGIIAKNRVCANLKLSVRIFN
jgi:hypothetical protein